MVISIVLLSASVILLSIGIYKQKNRLDYLESYLEDTDLKIDIKHNLNKEEIKDLNNRLDKFIRNYQNI